MTAGHGGPIAVNQTVVVSDREAPFPHLLHVVLCFFTCGAWLPIYLLHFILASRGGSTLLAWLLGIPIALGLPACGGCIAVGIVGSMFSAKAIEEARKNLDQADQLYTSGKTAEAVARYKESYGLATADRQPEIITRIVEHEIAQGNKAEARRWIDKGLADNISLAFSTPAASALLAQAKAEQDAKISQQQAQAAKPKRGVSRANYDRIKEGMTIQEVQDILGPGKEASRAGNLRVVTWQSGIVGLKIISITFENDRVAAKSILD